MDYPLVFSCRVSENAEDAVHRAEDGRVDGVVFHCDRGCQALSAGIPEAKLALKEKDILCVVYEGSVFNPIPTLPFCHIALKGQRPLPQAH
ncbi:MAG TPA: 2-hydroxyacyl-CoA dehydratase family protein, partial [Dehalococcoidia bacterium]|nr:2-hydroxyacyl-CoA dehydratase family protein [Dehalococcoidia bacterium]